MDYPRRHSLSVLSWAAKPPDLSPTETPWAIMKRKTPTLRRGIEGRTESRDIMNEVWNSMLQSTIELLSAQVPERMRLVRASPGISFSCMREPDPYFSTRFPVAAGRKTLTVESCCEWRMDPRVTKRSLGSRSRLPGEAPRDPESRCPCLHSWRSGTAETILPYQVRYPGIHHDRVRYQGPKKQYILISPSEVASPPPVMYTLSGLSHGAKAIQSWRNASVIGAEWVRAPFKLCNFTNDCLAAARRIVSTLGVPRVELGAGRIVTRKALYTCGTLGHFWGAECPAGSNLFLPGGLAEVYFWRIWRGSRTSPLGLDRVLRPVCLVAEETHAGQSSAVLSNDWAASSLRPLSLPLALQSLSVRSCEEHHDLRVDLFVPQLGVGVVEERAGGSCSRSGCGVYPAHSATCRRGASCCPGDIDAYKLDISVLGGPR